MLRKITSFVILVGFFSWAVWYVLGNADDFLIIKQVNWLDIGQLAAAFICILICNGAFIYVVSSAFDIKLRHIEWLSISSASSFANFFMPFRGGAGLRALYMSRLHGLSITDFISTLSVMYLMHAALNGFLALAGMVLVISNGGPIDLTLLIFFLLTTVTGLLFISLEINTAMDIKRFPFKQINQVLSGWKKVRQERSIVIRLWALMLILILITLWQCKVAFAAVSVPISWGGIAVYAASKNLAMLVGLTPGSLGIVEGVSIYLGHVLGYGTSEALLVQGLIRSITIVTLLIVGPISFLLLHRHIGSSR